MFGAQLKKIRKELELSQTQFGERLGKGLATIQRWEALEEPPKDSIINLICSVFGISETWLKTGTGNMYGSYSNNQSIQKNYGIQIQNNGNITHFGTPTNPMTEGVEKDVKELFEMILEYGTPKIIKQFKSKMEAIKKLHEE
ncbi:MAG: helix-turn-helix domain-containing protein [Deferribacterales bacterium]